MRRYQPLPRLWLVTDPRQGEALWPALWRLRRGSGVLFRDFERPSRERRAHFERVRAIARRQGLVLVLAGEPMTAVRWRADGWHAGSAPRRARIPALMTAAAHDRRELARARRAGAALVFVSPIFPTRSHPGAPTLGRVRLGLLVGMRRDDIVALGGLDRARGRALRGLGINRWAAIDGLTPADDQNRKAVPT